MGDIFNEWLGKPTTRDILAGYKADKLPADAQKALEDLVVTQGREISDGKYGKGVKVLRAASPGPGTMAGDLYGGKVEFLNVGGEFLINRFVDGFENFLVCVVIYVKSLIYLFKPFIHFVEPIVYLRESFIHFGNYAGFTLVYFSFELRFYFI